MTTDIPEPKEPIGPGTPEELVTQELILNFEQVSRDHLASATEILFEDGKFPSFTIYWKNDTNTDVTPESFRRVEQVDAINFTTATSAYNDGSRLSLSVGIQGFRLDFRAPKNNSLAEHKFHQIKNYVDGLDELKGTTIDEQRKSLRRVGNIATYGSGVPILIAAIIGFTKPNGVTMVALWIAGITMLIVGYRVTRRAFKVVGKRLPLFTIRYTPIKPSPWHGWRDSNVNLAILGFTAASFIVAILSYLR